jgi:HSP20 family molecular chaperone IbpA
VVEFELPGVHFDEVSVTLADDVLTLQSVKNKTKKEEKGEYFLRERHFGNFYRRVVLPEYVDAKYKNNFREC